MQLIFWKFFLYIYFRHFWFSKFRLFYHHYANNIPQLLLIEFDSTGLHFFQIINLHTLGKELCQGKYPFFYKVLFCGLWREEGCGEINRTTSGILSGARDLQSFEEYIKLIWGGFVYPLGLWSNSKLLQCTPFSKVNGQEFIYCAHLDKGELDYHWRPKLRVSTDRLGIPMCLYMLK